MLEPFLVLLFWCVCTAAAASDAVDTAAACLQCNNFINNLLCVRLVYDDINTCN